MLLDLAELYGRLGRDADIAALLEPAIRAEGTRPDGVQTELLGRYLEASMAVGDAGRARAALDRLLARVDMLDRQIRLVQARVRRLEGDTDGALAVLDDLARDRPGMDAALAVERAETLGAAGRGDAAAALWRDIAGRHGAGGAALPFLRRALGIDIAAGRGAAVRAELDGMIAVRPGNPELRDFAVSVLSAGGQVAAARMRAEAFAADFPDLAPAHRWLGVVAAAEGDRETGLAELGRALDLDPGAPEIWLTYLGVLSAGDADPDPVAVEAVLREAVAAVPDDPDLLQELGLALLADGRTEAAAQTFEDVLARAPGHPGALAASALTLADLDRDLPLARDRAERATAAWPDRAVNQDALGWVMVRQGETEPGAALLDRAARAAPGDATIRYHLAFAEIARDRPDAAADHLRAALAGRMNASDTREARARLLALDPVQEVGAVLRGGGTGWAG